MPHEEISYFIEPAGCKKIHQISVAKAIDGLVNAGLATIERPIESCCLLHLVTGEVFLLADDGILRIR